MKTIDIKGKSYVQVNERILYFRKHFPDLDFATELLKDENGVCVFKSWVYDENNHIRATGHAYEKEGSTFINKTSYIENCETSAVGRALGNFGIGISESVASAEEVGNAIKQQDNPQPPPNFVPPTEEQKKAMKDMLADAGKVNPGKYLTSKDAKEFKLTELNSDQFAARFDELNKEFAK